ncbi:MAG: hypothetical protein JSR59_20695 [Proteobacteria bacterium]|nr:hypothetical protein [Pseudomonadota bacterium]
MPLHPGAIGIIDEHLTAKGLQHLGAQPALRADPMMVADSRLVPTTGRLFCSRYEKALPVRVVECPVPFPPLIYYQLWHDLTHRSPQMQWFREQVRTVARELAENVPTRRRRTPSPAH